MIVVSDTTPLSELTKVGQLELLYNLYGKVIIPQEVFEEVTQGKHPAALSVPSASWVTVMSISNRQRLLEFQTETNLDLGESAAIILALELGADQLLLDDLDARQVALSLELPVIGTVGLLLLAKRQGFISNIKEILDGLIANGKRISKALYQQVLKEAGE